MMRCIEARIGPRRVLFTKLNQFSVFLIFGAKTMLQKYISFLEILFQNMKYQDS